MCILLFSAPNWPRLLSQFAILCSQLQTLYDELLTNERMWSSRLHASLALTHPLSASYNPATTLRVKPTAEADQFEQVAFEAFLADKDLAEYSAVELRDQINDFNAAALKLGRFAAQAAALPLPRDPVPVTSGPVRSRAEIERIEENELQKTLASMMHGRQTKILPQQPPQPQQQQQAPLVQQPQAAVPMQQ